MAQGNWFLAVVIAAVAVNGGFFVLAYSLPPHEEWLYYMDLDFPAEMTSANSADAVQARLAAAGYNVTKETQNGRTVLAAAKPSEHDYRALISGLGGPDGGRAQLDLQCRTGYFRDDCPRPLEPAMRARFAELLQDSGLALDATDAYFGDYDFATFNEFFLFMLQLLVAFISVIVVSVAGAISIGTRRRQRSASPGPYAVWTGLPAYGAPPPYPPLLQTQVQEHREGHELEPVGDHQERPEQPH